MVWFFFTLFVSKLVFIYLFIFNLEFLLGTLFKKKLGPFKKINKINKLKFKYKHL